MYQHYHIYTRKYTYIYVRAHTVPDARFKGHERLIYECAAAAAAHRAISPRVRRPPRDLFLAPLFSLSLLFLFAPRESGAASALVNNSRAAAAAAAQRREVEAARVENRRRVCICMYVQGRLVSEASARNCV